MSEGLTGLETDLLRHREKVAQLREEVAADTLRRAGVEPGGPAHKLVQKVYDGEPLHRLSATDGAAAVRAVLNEYGVKPAGGTR